LVGDTAVLITSLIGIKRNQHHNFMVVDSSMCEIIRPSLYEAYHHIEYIKPIDHLCNKVENLLVDIVGPVCESGDFLGKDRFMQVPHEDEEQVNLTNEPVYLAIMDVGAYCSSMSMNYNLHGKPCEIFVEELNDSLFKFYLTRKPDKLNDILNNFIF
jgi:diaminopimelate decarboxylase